MENKYLVLWLEAPLQSWGADSKFGRRDSLPFPTKSGIAGLLLCALGAKGEQIELLARFAQVKQTVVSFIKSGGISPEQKTMLRDFQMVGSGYNNNDEWETLLIPMGWDTQKQKSKKTNNADGSRGGTKLTYRYYLQDAKFAVILELESSLAELFTDALTIPVYDLYFGRKNCVPSDFIFRGVFDTEIEVAAALEIIKTEKGLSEKFRVIDGEVEGDVMVLNDVPLQFGEIKRYRDRIVTVVQS